MEKRAKFHGSLTALVTPFKDGEIDEPAYRALIDWQISSGSHGLVPVGTTGESPTLSHKEHYRAVESASQSAGAAHLEALAAALAEPARSGEPATSAGKKTRRLTLSVS